LKLIAFEKEVQGVSDSQFTEKLLRKEAARAWELQQAGLIRELYFRADRQEAILVLECKDTNEARSTLNTLPLVLAKLIDFEIIPLKPYPGFERLFGENTR
jgi:muconolactone delta-isomerase